MRDKFCISYFVKSAFCLFALQFIWPALLFADEPNVAAVKMLHIFIEADVNEVHFENIWVFERKSAAGRWDVAIRLPAGIVSYTLDEPNRMEFSAGEETIYKRMADDSLIDSVGFSFTLPNKNGLCQTQIVPDYQVYSMVVSVSGSAVKFVSEVLKFDEFRQSRSRFSGVYSAINLAAGTKVNIEIRGLPCRESSWPECVCVIGLGLIIVIALLTLYRNRKAAN